MEFAVDFIAVEATTTITVPEVMAMTSVSNEPVVGLTSVQVELIPVSRPVMERGSRSWPSRRALKLRLLGCLVRVQPPRSGAFIPKWLI